TGAILGWGLSLLLSDLGGVIESYGALDLTALVLLGGSVGGLVLGGTGLRRGQNVALEAAAGGLLGAGAARRGGCLGCLISGAAGLDGSRQGFLVARLLVWGIAAGLLGLVLAARSVMLDRVRILEGLLFGLASGAIAAMVYSLPGPTQIWQLLAF